MSSNVLEFNEFKILLATLCVLLGFFLALYAVHRFSMVLASYSFFVKRERDGTNGSKLCSPPYSFLSSSRIFFSLV